MTKSHSEAAGFFGLGYILKKVQSKCRPHWLSKLHTVDKDLTMFIFTTPAKLFEVMTSILPLILLVFKHLDHNDGKIFRAMEWLMFFLGHHCRQWFFNGFDKVGPSPLNVFLGVQPLEPMVFRWFSKFWGQWSTMVLRLTMESLVKIISPNDDNIISRYFKELWKIR